MKNSFLWMGRAEGISLLLLLFIAMPLKYIWGQPEAVRWVGAIHGGLFLAYVAMAAWIATTGKWSLWKLFLCLILSSVPFGTFYFEKKYL